jgi:hypothetical protein
LDEPQEEVLALFCDILFGREQLQMNVQLLTAVVHFFGWSGLRFQAQAAECYDILQKFIMMQADAMSSFDDQHKWTVAQVVASYATLLLKQVEDEELPLVSLTNALCSTENPDNIACLTALVGRVAVHANAEFVGEMVLPLLIRQFQERYDSPLIAGVTLSQLVELVFVDGIESLTEVINALSYASRAYSATSSKADAAVLRMVEA